MSAHVTTMHAHSPASYSLSLMIHGGLAAAIVLSAYFFNDIRKKSDGIFEVVAGPGDDWNARVAPAQGVPDAPDVPTFTPPPDAPHPVPPPEPVVEAPPEPAPVLPAATVPRDALVLPPPKALPKKTDAKQTQPTKSAPQSKMTKAEWDKLYGAKNKNPPSSKAPPKIASNNAATTSGKPVIAKTITTSGKGLLDGVAGGSGSAQGAGGRALTTVERDQLDAYFALLRERIKQAHEKPEGVSMELVTRVECQVAADGRIGAVKIIKSSGNRVFDDSVKKAFLSVSPIGPRPDGRSDAITVNFRMKEE